MLIVFDLDDTLIDTSSSITPVRLKEALLEMIKHGLKLPNFQKVLKKLLDINEKSKSSNEALEIFVDNLKIEKKNENLGKKILQSENLGGIKINTFHNVKKTLQSLAKNHTLALLSRGNERLQLNKMEKAGIDSTLFSKIVITDKNNKKNYYKQFLEDFKDIDTHSNW